MTEAAIVHDADPVVVEPSAPCRHVNLAIFALAIGGFAIGTTEFVTMGLLPKIASGVGITIPTAGHVVSADALGIGAVAAVSVIVGRRQAGPA